MNKLIELLQEMGAENVHYNKDDKAELLQFYFGGKKAMVCSWIGDDHSAGIEVDVATEGKATISISMQEPATFDKAGYEALDYVEMPINNQ